MTPAEPGGQELAVVSLSGDADVFAVRQLGRDLATAVGLDRLDVTRMATAISELAREAVGVQGGRLAFGIRDGRELVTTVAADGLTPDAASIASVRRLVDSLVHDTVDGRLEVTLTMRLSTPLTPEARERASGVVSAHAPHTPLDELRQQSADLAGLLDDVRAKNAELETLNLELEETNRGVVALYTELSDELERTNQGVVALYADIDEKNERLTAASAAKSRFLRSVSHELRTPVNSVLGLTRLMTGPGADALSAEQAEQVGFIRASATDLSTLVNELLDLAKAESGRLEPVWQDVDVAALCADLGGMTAPLLRAGVELVVDPVADGTVLRTDPDLLRHVLRNLLSNAAKFTESGSVRLTVEPGPDTTWLRVVDTGVGMSEEDRLQAFEEFYQARTPLHATVKGTGLGLPFAASVAQALGGAIEVESTPGVGSCFAVRLPAQPDEATREEGSEA